MPAYNPPTVAAPELVTVGAPVACNSGTSLTLSGIPAGCVRFAVVLTDVSVDNADDLLLQPTVGGTAETTGYVGLANQNNDPSASGGTSGAMVKNVSGAASIVWRGTVHFWRASSSTHLWHWSGMIHCTDATKNALTVGSKTLAGAVDGVKLRPSSTGNFDGSGTAALIVEDQA